MELVGLHGVEGKSGTNGENVFLFLVAFLLRIVIGDHASFIVIDFLDAESGRIRKFESDFVSSLGGVDDVLQEGSSRVGERVVVAGPVVVEGDAVGVGLNG